MLRDEFLQFIRGLLDGSGLLGLLSVALAAEEVRVGCAVESLANAAGRWGFSWSGFHFMCEDFLVEGNFSIRRISQKFLVIINYNTMIGLE